MSDSESFDIEEARRNLEARRRSQTFEKKRLFEKATADCRTIIDMIIERFHPARVYQWGSLLDEELFTDYSDIDIALEGIDTVEDIIELEKTAEGMTDFPLDIVRLEKIPKAYAETIRAKGRIVYERDRS